MTEPTYVDVWNVVSDGLTLALQASVAGVAGWWTYRNFIRHRLNADRIEVDCDVKVFGLFKSEYAAEFSIFIKNVGQTRFKANRLEVRIRGILNSDQLTDFEYRAGRTDNANTARVLNFPIKIFESPDVLPESFYYFFVEPGVTQRYTLTVRFSSDIRLVCIHATLPYADQESDFHSSERTFDVQASLVESVERKSRPIP